MRSIVAMVLTLALLATGCLGSTVDPAATDTASAPALPLATASAEWAVAATGDFAIGEPVMVPAGAGALFVDFDAEVQGPRSSLEVRAISPEGDETVIGRVASLTGDPVRRANWALLEAEAGEWSFLGVGEGSSTGVLNVTVVAREAIDARVPGTGEDRVVVAVVDTGVNPYHDVFQRAEFVRGALPARIVEAETGLPPLVVPLRREADLLATLRADAGMWASVPAETLVHFEGTNILGYEVDETTLPALPVLDRAGHGTAVSHAVTNDNADVLVVMITANDYDAGVRWATSQPWIDLISLSWGPPVNAIGSALNAAGMIVTPETTREAWNAGKVVFTASGNDPTPTFTDTTSGPIWAHAVSGSLPKQGGRAVPSGNFVDTVANFTQELALYNSLDELRVTSGTSFATPTTASVASRILHEVRARSAHEGGIVEGALVRAGDLVVTNGDLRDAINATALYWETTGYSPSPMAAPIAPAPWVSQGWGHVDGSIVPVAVDHLLGTPAPAKPAPAAAWMMAWHEAREAAWS